MNDSGRLHCLLGEFIVYNEEAVPNDGVFVIKVNCFDFGCLYLNDLTLNNHGAFEVCF